MEDSFISVSTTTSSYVGEEMKSSSWYNVDYLSIVNESLAVSNEIYAMSDSSLHPFGPERDPLYVVLPITIIYLSLLFTGTIGNVSTCIVIARNKSMHTATNYYLFSLAISDLLLLISGLPVEVYLVWDKYSYVFGEGFCMFRGMAAECSTNASVLTITAFTVERYVAICHPFRSHTMSKLSRAIKFILVIWLLALSFAIPMALQFGLVKHADNTNIVLCTLKFTLYRHSFEIATLLFFVIPMILITVLYVMIGLKLRQSNMMKRDNSSGNERNTTLRESSSGTATGNSRVKKRNCRHHTGRNSRRVLKMLVAVVVAFFICWAPFHVQRLIAIHGTNEVDHVTSKSKWMEFLYLLFTYVSGVLYYVSATINPILYNIMSNKFREAFMETIARSCGRPTYSVRQEQRSYSSLSRSQQRGNAGIFGSRTVGTGGIGVAHDSADYSTNLLRDESIKRSTSMGGCQAEVATSLEASCDKSQSFISNGGGRFSSLRQISTNKNLSNNVSNNEACVKLLDSSNQMPTVEVQIRDKLSSVERPERNDLSNNSAASTNNRTHSTFNNRSNHHNHNHNHQYRPRNQFGLGTIDTDPARRKKWWHLFKWLPDATFKFNRRTRYANPVNNFNDIESTREEYSMASRHVRNGTDQRPV